MTVTPANAAFIRNTEAVARAKTSWPSLKVTRGWSKEGKRHWVILEVAGIDTKARVFLVEDLREKELLASADDVLATLDAQLRRAAVSFNNRLDLTSNDDDDDDDELKTYQDGLF